MKEWKVKEKDIQNAILEYLHLRGIFAWPIQNQGQYDPFKKIYRKTPKWFVHGLPDIQAALSRGRALHIEVKSPTGKQSDHQKIFQEKVERAGHSYIVARSVQEVDDFLRVTGRSDQNGTSSTASDK